MNSQNHSPLTHTWKAQICQLAAHNPRLAQQLWQNRQAYFARFVHFYRQLGDLPRKVRRKFLKRLATTLAGAALLLALGQPLQVRAATITVDGVTCTLAKAITAANTDTATGGCPAGSGPDVIDLQTDVHLFVALPQITSEITLEGNGHMINRDNNLREFRILYVQASGDLTLNNAMITGGFAYSGGGITNGGILSVNNSIITANSAEGQGGGIRNFGTLTINNSTLSGNTAGLTGGAIINHVGTVTVNNSTIADNSGGNSGGGISNVATLIINNSTLSGNSSSIFGGGIFIGNGSVTLNNSTLTGNSSQFGGGLYRNTFVPFANLNQSLISGNSASGSGEEVFGAANANNYNVVGYGGSARSVGFSPGPHDIIPPGSLDTVLDPTLADNGGPTLTHALISGSVAIDTAPDAACLAPPMNGIDQRGYARNLNGDGVRSHNECDTGAFEFAPSAPPTPAPRPTRTPTPALLVQGSALFPPSQESAPYSFFNWFAVICLALGNLLLLKKRRT